MRREEFYDLSLNEWIATIDGYRKANGLDTPGPATWDDFENFRE